MSENALLGTLPAELGELTDLERLCGRLPTLGLGAQRCPGTLGIVARIAVVLCRVCSLLHSNVFSGTIGSWIGSMAKLTYLFFGYFGMF